MKDNNQTLLGCRTFWQHVSVLAGHLCSHGDGDSIVNSWRRIFMQDHSMR
jgi:hypothetical protein